MKVRRILHHSVNVQGGLDQASAFYGNVLGLEVAPRPDIAGVDGRWFRVGEGQIHLVDADPGSGPIRPADRHVCLAVESIDDATRQLDEFEVPYLTAAQGTVVQVFLVDPCGNVIELQEDRDLVRGPSPEDP